MEIQIQANGVHGAHHEVNTLFSELCKSYTATVVSGFVVFFWGGGRGRGWWVVCCCSSAVVVVGSIEFVLGSSYGVGWVGVVGILKLLSLEFRVRSLEFDPLQKSGSALD